RIRIDPVAVFIARVEARAMLWAVGEMTLHDAVDELWADVARDGLVARLGVDKAQEIMAAAFAAVRDDLLQFEETEPAFADDAWSGPGRRDSAVDYHKDRGDRVSGRPYTADELARPRELMADEVTLERAWHEINHPTDRAAASTVEVLMALRERSTAALMEPDVEREIGALSESQLHEVCARLQKLRPEIARPWPDSDVERLVEAWVTYHGDG